MKRVTTMACALGCYAAGMASLFYMIAWLVNAGVPITIDSAAAKPIAQALLINAGLFALFGIQHSVMARPAFKRWWTQFVPQELERGIYCLASGLALVAIMLLWQPTGVMVWNVENTIGKGLLYGVYALGWVVLVGSTFALNHFDLFGLRQAWLKSRNAEYSDLEFSTPGPYRMVRHPIYVGWITLVWATPNMSLSHLMFAVATTAYILFAIRLEERDLVAHHGDKYTNYCKTTPMLIPRFNSLPEKKSVVSAGTERIQST